MKRLLEPAAALLTDDPPSLTDDPPSLTDDRVPPDLVDAPPPPVPPWLQPVRALPPRPGPQGSDSSGVLPDAPLNDEAHAPAPNPADILLGDYFLERGETMLLVGPAGCGKSVAGYQMGYEWAAGLPSFHIPPPHPLRVVILQTEDSPNKFRQIRRDILDSTLFKPPHLERIKANLFVYQVAGGAPVRLTCMLREAHTRHNAHLVIVNPLLAFVPTGDPREVGTLLYQSLDPVIKELRIGLVGIHHTPKTNRVDTGGYSRHDWQYLAAGDARVANMARVVIQILGTDTDGVYRFRLAKAWGSPWTWDGSPTLERVFKWADHGRRWIDGAPEDVEAKTQDDFRRILDVLPAPDKPPMSRAEIRQVARDQLRIGLNRANDWLNVALQKGLVTAERKTTGNGRRVEVFRRAA